MRSSPKSKKSNESIPHQICGLLLPTERFEAALAPISLLPLCPSLAASFAAANALELLELALVVLLCAVRSLIRS
jgi:hypothetical protein